MTSSEAGNVVLVERRAGVAVITMNRPDQRNALNGELPEFLQPPYNEARHVGITGNPYYCPLADWAIPQAATYAKRGWDPPF